MYALSGIKLFRNMLPEHVRISRVDMLQGKGRCWPEPAVLVIFSFGTAFLDTIRIYW
jgi:hypothetical protein